MRVFLFHFVILCRLLWLWLASARAFVSILACASCYLIPWCKLVLECFLPTAQSYAQSLPCEGVCVWIFDIQQKTSMLLFRLQSAKWIYICMFHLSKVLSTRECSLRKSILWIFSSVFTFWLLSYLFMDIGFLFSGHMLLCCIIVVIQMYKLLCLCVCDLNTRHHVYIILFQFFSL